MTNSFLDLGRGAGMDQGVSRGQRTQQGHARPLAVGS